jgi:tetratricopeptide (TPR) repeat protein
MRLHDEALRHFQLATEIDTQLDAAYIEYGALLLDQGRFQEAANQFSRAIEINPYNARAHAYTGYLRETALDAAEAVRYYRSALENWPDYPQARVRVGAVFLQRRQPGEAERYFSSAIEVAGVQSARLLYQIAFLYERSGDKAGAEAYRQRAREAAARNGQSAIAWDTEAERWPLG